jgi:hypothetical protein
MAMHQAKRGLHFNQLSRKEAVAPTNGIGCTFTRKGATKTAGLK